MRVFISSVITGYEAFRDAVDTAIRSLGHEVIRAEDFGALSSTPQQACLDGVRQADVVVLLVGSRYGTAQALGYSATEEEYREARESKPVLVFVEGVSSREQRQETFLAEIQSWSRGHLTEDFTRPESLRVAVTRQLHRLELSQQAGTVDPEEMQRRAMQLIPEHDRGSYKESLVLAVAGGPRQSILRPATIESRDIYDALLQAGSFGPHRVLDTRHGTQRVIRDDALLLEQPDASVYLNEEGSVRVIIPARDPESHDVMSLPFIIQEDVEEGLIRAIQYADRVLDHVDPTHRLTRVALVASVQGGGQFGWRTREQHARSPNSGEVNLRSNSEPAGLSPPDRSRGSLRSHAREIAEDLTTRLRRRSQR